MLTQTGIQDKAYFANCLLNVPTLSSDTFTSRCHSYLKTSKVKQFHLFFTLMKKVATTSTMLLLWDGALIFLATNWYSILNTGNLHYGDVGTTVADTVTDAGTAAVTDPVADTGLVVVFILAACPAFCICTVRRTAWVNLWLGSRHREVLSFSMTMTSCLLQ